MREAIEECLVPQCDREVRSRGLCSGHYGAARHYVARGKTTWERLEATGKSLPLRDGKNSEFGAWLFDEGEAGA